MNNVAPDSLNSALYVGKVFHKRHQPKEHAFSYEIFQFWLDLSEIDSVCSAVSGISKSRFAPVRFKREDYLGDPSKPLLQSVLEKMTELHGSPLTGRVFLLGQMRMFGLYFSPVNFYYLLQPDGTFSHMLAEVSNTPWNERHHYLVDLSLQESCDKAFHVSPFNPMEMTYHWRVGQPSDKLQLTLSCHGGSKHFDASIDFTKKTLSSKNLFLTMLSIPNMTIKTVWGIYWQALKLWFKGAPVYSHPMTKK